MKISMIPLLLLSGFCAKSQNNAIAFVMPTEIKFEKSIVQRINKDKKNNDINYFFRSAGDYAAMKVGGKDGETLIIYTGSGNMLIVNDKEKLILVMNVGKFINDAAKIGKDMADNKKAGTPSNDSLARHRNFVKTGRTKTICGYPAEEYEITSKKGKSYSWLLKADFDTRLIYTMGMGKTGNVAGGNRDQNEENNPISIVTGNKNLFIAETDVNGQPELETVSINKTDFVFSSKGYTIRDMSEMLKGRGN